METAFLLPGGSWHFLELILGKHHNGSFTWSFHHPTNAYYSLNRYIELWKKTHTKIQTPSLRTNYRSFSYTYTQYIINATYIISHSKHSENSGDKKKKWLLDWDLYWVPDVDLRRNVRGYGFCFYSVDFVQTT